MNQKVARLKFERRNRFFMFKLFYLLHCAACGKQFEGPGIEIVTFNDIRFRVCSDKCAVAARKPTPAK